MPRNERRFPPPWFVEDKGVYWARGVIMLRSILFAVCVMLLSGAAMPALAQCFQACSQKYCAHGVFNPQVCLVKCSGWCAEFQQTHCGGKCSKEQWVYWKARNFR
jgi:hypothetical protein